MNKNGRWHIPAIGIAPLSVPNRTAKILTTRIAPEVEALPGRSVHVFEAWCAARVLVKIARGVFGGAGSIPGPGVDVEKFP